MSMATNTKKITDNVISSILIVFSTVTLWTINFREKVNNKLIALC